MAELMALRSTALALALAGRPAERQSTGERLEHRQSITHQIIKSSDGREGWSGMEFESASFRSCRV